MIEKHNFNQAFSIFPIFWGGFFEIYILFHLFQDDWRPWPCLPGGAMQCTRTGTWMVELHIRSNHEEMGCESEREVLKDSNSTSRDISDNIKIR